MSFLLPGHNLMIVAHPDDETIFGYTQLITKNSDWTVLCITNAGNAERRTEFQKVLSTVYCIPWTIWNYEDRWGAPIDLDCEDSLVDFLVHEKYDHVVTHNEAGEYGHSQHASLHQLVKALVPSNLFVFEKSARPLPFTVLQDKMRVLELYQSQHSLNAWDWYDPNRPSESLMSYIVHEDLRQIA